ncbi:conserved hypothetical protein [Ricinus communis]|uniref:Uncharacterized protein n=1 Tax=Ricinus communis TaxID=3988 RepID=B9SE36_RICCO|nr:conserved hypothetical protein [Ricinus communis]|eukprot:XP_025014025.1 uncharacterized protein LOC8287503 isoform X2 [Ricinus communis]
MENKRQTGASSLDHLFGPKDSSSSSSSSSSVFGSIFSPPSMGMGRDSAGIMGNQAGNSKYGIPDNVTQSNKGSNSGIMGKDSSSFYQNETAEPCYFSSSIYYGGQENYSPRTRNSESHVLKKDDKKDDPNGNSSNSASRGNWWQGSLYY